MLGATKKASTQRLDEGVYIENLAEMYMRFQPKRFNKYTMKHEHITFDMFCDPYDIEVGDRILWDQPGVLDTRIFVVAGVEENNDGLGAHFQLVVREVASKHHSEVTLRTPAQVQSNYDPVLNEYTSAGKSYDDETIKALIDPMENLKNEFVRILPEGKLEGIEYLMTVDLPQEINSNHIVQIGGTAYTVEWVVPHPFQKLVGLKKDIENYDT